jgi:hypothetical protein
MECGEKARLVEEHHKAAIAYSRAARALAHEKEHMLCFRI